MIKFLLYYYLIFFSPLIVAGQGDIFGPEQILFDGLNTSSPDRSFLGGDFNGDGNLDFAGLLSTGLGIFQSNGDLSYDTVQLPDEFFEFPISVADMNSDGVEDLVSTDAFYTLDSTSGFKRQPLNLGSFQLVRFARDINKDGYADIVTEMNEPGEDRVMFLHLNLNGNDFESKVLDNTKPNYDFALAADYNQDSWVDIVIADASDDRILLYRNSASGTIIKSSISVDGRVNEKLLGVADMDGDQDLDFITGGAGDPFEGLLYLENINSTFTTKHEMIKLITQALAVEIADLDGDSDLDVIAVVQLFSGPYQVGYSLNMGEDNWSEFELLATFTQFGSFAYQNPNIFDNWLQFADVDGDGRKDVIVSAIKDGEVIWFKNLTTTSLAPVIGTPLKVYPQPAGTTLLFDGIPDGNNLLIIYDMMGVKKQQNFITYQEHVDVQKLDSGPYFYSIKSPSGLHFRGKLIISD